MKKTFVLEISILLALVVVASGCIKQQAQDSEKNKSWDNTTNVTQNISGVAPETGSIPLKNESQTRNVTTSTKNVTTPSSFISGGGGVGGAGSSGGGGDDAETTTGTSVTLKGIEKNDIVIYYYVGSMDFIYLFNDSTFLRVGEAPHVPDVCIEGEVNKSRYFSFIEFVKTSGFFETMPIRDDENLTCNLTAVEAKIGNLSNFLQIPCIQNMSLGGNITSIIGNISAELRSLANTTTALCRQGGYIEAVAMAKKCPEIAQDHITYLGEGLQFYSYNFSSLDENLKTSLRNSGALTYVGSANMTLYDKKYYDVDGSCYFILYHEFNGTSFS